MNENALRATYFLDHDHPSVQEFAQNHTKGLSDDKAKAIRLYDVVRDKFMYDPYRLDLSKEAMRASEILKRDSAYCNEKAIVLAAALRAVGIPTRLYFGNVRNHIATEKLREMTKTDIMAFHGCVEIWLNEKWVKATPAFNTSLCQKLGVEPLEFDGENDSIFQEFSKDGRRFMEYIEIHGSFYDMPHSLFLMELAKHYGHLASASKEGEMTFDIGAVSG